MEITRREVEHIARLSNLALSEDEIIRYQKDLSAVLSYMDTLNSLETGLVPEVSSEQPLIPKLMRDDIPAKPLPVSMVLQNAPDPEDSFFRVPRVIDA